jgi:hypothetical protein
MFVTEPGLFSIGIIVFPTSFWSDQPVKLITSVGLKLVKHVNKLDEPMSEPLVLSNILVESIHV